MNSRLIGCAILTLTTLVLAYGTASPAEARSRKTVLSEAAGEMIDEALVKPPQDGEVCFAPEEPCDTKLVKFVESAQKSIDIAIYDLNLDHLVDRLLRASKKISVRILVDRRQAKGSHSLVPLLIRAGARIRYGHQRGIMHNKFTLIDGKRVETGSFNYTHHASRANNENQVYLENPAIVERYAKRFDQIWAQADPVVAD